VSCTLPASSRTKSSRPRRPRSSTAELHALQERRAFECRLTPDRALDALDDAEEFLRDRGLLTRTSDCALPSLFEACHEEPYAADSPGFGQWPRTKYPWFGELGARGFPVLAVHRGKSLLVTEETAQLMDPICRAEIARMEAADPEWARLLGHLAEAGPSELEDLQVELGLKPKELKRLRAPLERCGAIVSRALVYSDPHRHTSELARWDTAEVWHSQPSASHVRNALADLVVAGVRAAVVAPAAEIRRWFSWEWYWDESILEDERLVQVAGNVALAG
jgi:hypothetical protein